MFQKPGSVPYLDEAFVRAEDVFHLVLQLLLLLRGQGSRLAHGVCHLGQRDEDLVKTTEVSDPVGQEDAGSGLVVLGLGASADAL